MIKFVCLACRKHLSVKDETAGKEATCPHCYASNQVPFEPPRTEDTELRKRAGHSRFTWFLMGVFDAVFNVDIVPKKVQDAHRRLQNAKARQSERVLRVLMAGRFGWFLAVLLIAAVVGVYLLAVDRESRPLCPLPVPLATGLWVFLDAKAIGVRKGQLHPTGFWRWFADNDPEGWAAGCIFVWIVAFPWYLAVRGKYKQVNRTQ